jgi:hypothetical protein
MRFPPSALCSWLMTCGAHPHVRDSRAKLSPSHECCRFGPSPWGLQLTPNKNHCKTVESIESIVLSLFLRWPLVKSDLSLWSIHKGSKTVLLEFKANKLPRLIHVHAYFIFSWQLSLLIMLSVPFLLNSFYEKPSGLCLGLLVWWVINLL